MIELMILMYLQAQIRSYLIKQDVIFTVTSIQQVTILLMICFIRILLLQLQIYQQKHQRVIYFVQQAKIFQQLRHSLHNSLNKLLSFVNIDYQTIQFINYLCHWIDNPCWNIQQSLYFILIFQLSQPHSFLIKIYINYTRKRFYYNNYSATLRLKLFKRLNIIYLTLYQQNNNGESISSQKKYISKLKLQFNKKPKKMINKLSNNNKNKQIASKIQAKILQFIKTKKQINKNDQFALDKQEQQQAAILFDELSLKSLSEKMEEEGEDQFSKQKKQQEVYEDKEGSGKSDQDQSQQQNKLDRKIISILKNGNISKLIQQKKKKVTFADQRQDNLIVLEGNRKWNQKLKSPRKGKFDPQQKRLLIQSLSQLLNQANLSLDEVVKTISQDQQKIPRNLHFWTKVCSVLPDRTLVSSYKFLKRQLSTKNKGGDWTEDETILLEQLVKKYGRKWALIAKQMHRTSQNIRDKYRSLGQQNFNVNNQQTVWKFSQLSTYLTYIQKYSKIHFLDQNIQKQVAQAQKHDEIQLKQLKQRRYNSKTFNFHNNEIVRKYIKKQFYKIKTEDINWQKISDKIQTKTIFDCRNKFVQLLQLEFNGLSSKQSIQRDIVKFIYEQKPKYETDINWQKWQNKEISSQQAKNRWMILKRHILGRGQKTFQQLITSVYQKFHLRKV